MKDYYEQASIVSNEPFIKTVLENNFNMHLQMLYNIA